SLQEVLNAIVCVANGSTYFDNNININALQLDDPDKKKGVLTKRQMEILELIAQGKTSREISKQLFIGIYTVDTHRKNMVRIIGLKGKGELMRYALEKKYKF
ncbi:MAG: response regulator transcription factor, partial [Flavobacteriaceae bacterium]|nr:response regulator transcription factor [Flavobacteriaceae bacterium]